MEKKILYVVFHIFQQELEVGKETPSLPPAQTAYRKTFHERYLRGHSTTLFDSLRTGHK
jgi:hypothetical protein